MGLSIRLLASVSRAPEALDAAVASPYGWTTDIFDDARVRWR